MKSILCEYSFRFFFATNIASEGSIKTSFAFEFFFKNSLDHLPLPHPMSATYLAS